MRVFGKLSKNDVTELPCTFNRWRRKIATEQLELGKQPQIGHKQYKCA